ncbi:MAG: 30S ribosomal protein S3 [Clostridia bacterium]|nr:30S ribosomal protein S3 [Clostridia bacterium]
MGQKVNPQAVRVGVINGWSAQWYANKKDFAKNLKQDHDIRTFIKKKYYSYGISKVVIERSQSKVVVNIYTGKTGMLIGTKGAGVEQIRGELKKLTGLNEIRINIHEVKKIDLDATLVAEGVALRLEKRESFRRTMKKSMGNVMRSGAKGVKIMVSGRLDGAEIARSEHYHEGSIPLQTLRADIDYGFAEAHTTFGVIGVKVWIYKGEVLGRTSKPSKEGGNNNVDA